MITSSPCFQFTGVATLCFAVNWSESTTRKTSSKLRPWSWDNQNELDLLVGADDEDIAHGVIVGGGALRGVSVSRRREHAPCFETLRSGSPIIG